MKKNIIITLLILVILIAFSLYLKSNKVIVDENPLVINATTTESSNIENMDLVVYVQDKEMARTTDCRVTLKKTYQVPKTEAVADVSLKLLFSDELKAYGMYKSITIENSVAKVMLESDMTPEGKPIGSLSSCESGHLLSVLTDTLTQYDSIQSVKLYSSKGEIMF